MKRVPKILGQSEGAKQTFESESSYIHETAVSWLSKNKTRCNYFFANRNPKSSLKPNPLFLLIYLSVLHFVIQNYTL